MKSNNGFAPLVIVIIVGILIVGGGYLYFSKKDSTTPKTQVDVPDIKKEVKELPPTKEPKVENPTPKINIDYIKVNSDNPVVVANNQFTFDIYSKLTEKDENIFYSPFSIGSAFAMVYEGAKGKTESEIQSVFHFPKDKNILRNTFASINSEINKSNSNFKLSTANALWAQNDYKFLNSYLTTIDQYYGGKVTNLDFKTNTDGARQTINKWVEEKTNFKIKDLLSPGSLNIDTKLVLTNAIYFKGQWQDAFDKKDTYDQDFKVNSSSSVKVQMMGNTDKDAKYKYGETKNLQIVEMPYKGDKISMIVLLPKDNDISSLEKSLSVEKLKEWKNSLIKNRIYLYLPKFKIDTKYSLANTLSKMGLATSFTENADFSGMDGTKDLLISDVIHKAYIEVNEGGTEAAAATAIIIATSSMRVGEDTTPVFRADHPFLFIIQDTTNGNILFIGKISDPTK